MSTCAVCLCSNCKKQSQEKCHCELFPTNFLNCQGDNAITWCAEYKPIKPIKRKRPISYYIFKIFEDILIGAIALLGLAMICYTHAFHNLPEFLK